MALPSPGCSGTCVPRGPVGCWEEDPVAHLKEPRGSAQSKTDTGVPRHTMFNTHTNIVCLKHLVELDDYGCILEPSVRNS